MVKGRFAPSPSGRMHLGNVFSALIAWLSVRAQDGTMVLRIEDLDPDRCKQAYAEQLKEDLLWLGLTWDEEAIPQSKRSSAYREQFERLEALGLVYPCYCTRNELHDASAPHASDGNPIYSGRCRKLSVEERAQQTRKPAWRLCVPDKEVSFVDGLQGEYHENLAKDCGDFIIRRSDGVYAYQLAVVTDDAANGITEVVRGCDLLSSTPRQLYLYELLGYQAPQFYHVPLLVTEQGVRLSKRDRACDLSYLRTVSSPERIFGLLASGCGLIDQNAPISLPELLSEFSREKLKGKRQIVLQNTFTE